MEIVNEQRSFIDRVLYPRIYYLMGILLLCILVLWIISSDAKNIFVISFFTAVFLGLVGLAGADKYATNWIEIIDVNEEDHTCHLRLLKKDDVFIDEIIPIERLRFEIVTIVGKYNFYKLNIYIDGELVFSQNEIHTIGRKKMQEIVRYFNPNDKMANARLR